jgi:hypothetical protein
MRRRTLLALAAAALVLAAASAAYQRVGPRRMLTGEAWCSTPAPCAVPVLGAGFPLPFLIDNPQISVPNAIGLVEDDLRPGAFLLDALFYFALAVLVFSYRIRLNTRYKQEQLASPRGHRGHRDLDPL